MMKNPDESERHDRFFDFTSHAVVIPRERAGCSVENWDVETAVVGDTETGLEARPTLRRVARHRTDFQGRRRIHIIDSCRSLTLARSLQVLLHCCAGIVIRRNAEEAWAQIIPSPGAA
jgi:hypothetical protein